MFRVSLHHVRLPVIEGRAERHLPHPRWVERAPILPVVADAVIRATAKGSLCGIKRFVEPPISHESAEMVELMELLCDAGRIPRVPCPSINRCLEVSKGPHRACPLPRGARGANHHSLEVLPGIEEEALLPSSTYRTSIMCHICTATPKVPTLS
jgi:hypothetical protein